MQEIISGDHYSVSDRTKQYVEEEAAKLEARAVKAQEEADVAQDVLNEETKKLHLTNRRISNDSRRKYLQIPVQEQ